MTRRGCVLCLVLVLGLAWCGAVRADTEIHPDWLSFDRGRRLVTIQITAALNGVNGTMNFNGYANGAMTIIVPLNWQVKIRFTVSGIGALPHSLVITKQFEQFPKTAGPKDAVFRGAYSRSPTTGMLRGSDTLRFRADKAGTFLLFCGVAGHGLMGMWDYFVVSPEARQPQVMIRQ